ncbi:MAG TPA: DUF1573 domain-containing protein [Gemmataceae bacterium]|nr:DUF1573 domain-containing protein [Gemmataceae bacterium]
MLPRAHILLALCVPIVLSLRVEHVRADLECAQSVVDKGEVKSGLPLAHRFRFTNRGAESVEITDVHPSCGCLAPKLEKRSLQPGESAELLLEVNTLTQPAGQNNWRITLRYKSGAVEQELPLYIRALLVTEITVEPPSLAIYTDSAISHEITVIDRRTEPLIVRAVPSSSPHVHTHLGELRRDDAGRWRRTIRVEVLEDCPEGTHVETLRICTSDPLYSELKVPFTIVKRSRRQVSAAPASVVLSESADRPLPSRIVLLSTADDREVQIDRIESDHPAIDCRWAQGPGHQATLKIRVDRKQISGDRLRAAVRVHLSRPAPETITIPVSCLIR